MPKYVITVSAVNVKNKQDLHFHTNLIVSVFSKLKHKCRETSTVQN